MRLLERSKESSMTESKAVIRKAMRLDTAPQLLGNPLRPKRRVTYD